MGKGQTWRKRKHGGPGDGVEEDDEDGTTGRKGSKKHKFQKGTARRKFQKRMADPLQSFKF
jgi:hypothetical protein